jgi:hypothetical protein
MKSEAHQPMVSKSCTSTQTKGNKLVPKRLSIKCKRKKNHNHENLTRAFLLEFSVFSYNHHKNEMFQEMKLLTDNTSPILLETFSATFETGLRSEKMVRTYLVIQISNRKATFAHSNRIRAEANILLLIAPKFMCIRGEFICARSVARFASTELLVTTDSNNRKYLELTSRM